MSIRIACEADIPQILSIYAPYVSETTYSFEYTVPTGEAFLHRFRSITERFPWLVWEEDGRVLGYAYGSLPFERSGYAWCTESSIYLAPEAQGKGIGRRLYSAMEKLLQIQGFRIIYAIITEENKSSVAFHEKLGYHVTAEFPACGYKFGRWLNVLWMEKRLDHEGSPNTAPTPWKTIVENDRKFHDILAILSLS